MYMYIYIHAMNTVARSNALLIRKTRHVGGRGSVETDLTTIEGV